MASEQQLTPEEPNQKPVSAEIAESSENSEHTESPANPSAAAGVERKTWKGFAASVKDDLLTRANISLVTGAAAVAALGLVGGLDSTTPDVASYVVDEHPVIKAAPATITIDGWVEAMVPTLQITAVNTQSQSLAPMDLARMFEPGVLIERDGAPLSSPLSPDVPTTIAVALPEGQDTLSVFALKYRVSALDGSYGYFDPKMVAQVRAQ